MATNFGPLAAQSDPRLLEYFHKTEQIKELVTPSGSGHQFIVVSRPGAGKSALFEWISDSAADLSARPVRGAEVRIVPSDETLNIDDYRTLCLSELGLSTALWAGDELKSSLSEGTVSLLRSFKRSKGYKKLKDGFARFEGGSILGCGFTLSPSERADYMSILRDTEYQARLKDLLAAVGHDAAPLLVMDDPEFTVASGLDELTEANAKRLGGLFSALATLDGLGITVLAFAREHVYQAVLDHYNDASHFADRTQGLGWTEADLLELVELRLRRRIAQDWDEVFAMDRETFVATTFRHLVNGPRDLLFICNKAIAEGVPVSTSKLARASDLLAADRWKETQKQFGSLYPGFERFVAGVIAALDAPDSACSPDQLSSLIQGALQDPESEVHGLRSEHDWVDALTFEPQTAIDLLYGAGVLGYLSDDQRVYPWSGRYVGSFHLAEEYFVSPAFLPRDTASR